MTKNAKLTFAVVMCEIIFDYLRKRNTAGTNEVYLLSYYYRLIIYIYQQSGYIF